MSAVTLQFKGGARMQAYLAAMQTATSAARAVRVGFLEKSTYPAQASASGTPRPALHVAQVAFWNEFGTSRAPARPFFRQMIAKESPTWGDKLGNGLKATQYDAAKTLGLVGVDIKDSLTQEIASWPADNAPSTVKRKGFNHGLIWHGIMQRSTDFEVLK